MSFPGAGPPPQGVTPDLEHPQDVLRTINWATQAATLAIVTGFVAIRVFAKAKVQGWTFTSDDYFTYSAYVFMVGYITTALFAGYNDGGYNVWEVRKDRVQAFFKSCYAATIFYAPMALNVKLALVVMIVRVFGSVHKKTRLGLYIFMGMLVAYYVSGLFIKIFICWPISAYWHGETEKCLNQGAIITADSIISVVSDLVILLAPTPLTWSLQLPLRKRLRVIGILCAGGVATGFSVYRLIMILHEGNSPNQSIVFIKVILSGNAEVGIGLICTCLPAITAYLNRRRKGTSYYDSHSQSRTANPNTNDGIIMTRTFHVDNASRSTKLADEEVYAFGHDEAGLVSEAQANPRSYSRRSESTN